MHLPAVDNPNNQHYFLNPVVKESIYNFKRKKYIYNFTQLRKTKIYIQKYCSFKK